MFYLGYIVAFPDDRESYKISGVPQDTVLGPILFTTPIVDVGVICSESTTLSHSERR